MTRVAIETLNALGSAWAGAMWKSLVEGTALLVIVGLAWLLLRRRASSAFLHGLFLLVLIKAAMPIALPYTLSVSLPWPPTLTRTVEPITSEDLVSESRAIPSERLVPPPTARLGLSAALMLAWAAVVASLLTRFVIAHVQMGRRLRGARLIDRDELPFDPAHLSALAGLWRPVPIVETNCVAAPAIWGLVRPRLLVPAKLIESLPTEQLTWAFLHELVHVRRGDNWVLLFQRLIQIVFFFNPAVWIANRAADIFREFACDDASMALAGVDRHECGAGFLAIAEWACRTRTKPAPIALGLFGSRALIHKRLERILDDSRPVSPRLSWGAVTLLGVAALAVLPVVRAQPPAPEPSKTKTAGRSTQPSKVDPKIRTSELEPGSTIGGLVKDSAGRPIAGVLVHVVSKGQGEDADVREHSHKTDAEGRWQCSEVPADLSKTSFRFEHLDRAKVAPDSGLPVFKNLDKERHQWAIAQMMKTETELIDAESALLVLEAALRTRDEELPQLIEAEFKKDPEVVGLIGEITETHDQLEHAKAGARQATDPALVGVRKHQHKLVDRYENLWKIKYEEILQRLRRAPSALEISDLRKKVAALRNKKERLTKNLEQLEVKKQTSRE